MAYEPPQGSTEDDSPEGRGLAGDRYSTPAGAPQNAGSTRKADPGDYGTLPRSYLSILTRARVDTYTEEIPNASWGKTLLGVAIVTVVTFGMKIVLAPFTLQNLDDLQHQLASQGQYLDKEPFKSLYQWARDSTSPLLTLLVPITFFAGAGLFYVLSRATRSKEARSEPGSSFMTHAYLLSLSYTPMRALAALLGALALVPIANCLGFLITTGLGIYQLYSAGLSMQASQKLEPGKAQMVAFMPWVVGVLLSIVVVIVAVVLIAPTLLNKG